MVGDERSLRGGGLGSADVQPPIDLHRVHRDYFAIQSECQFKGHGRLSGSRRAGQENGAHFGVLPPTGFPEWVTVSACQERIRRMATAVQIAESATLKAGNPTSEPLRRFQ